MTTKRTHGPCTCPCPPGTGTYFEGHHYGSCPSLYPAQHEPDALTRLCRLVRERWTTDADDRPITDVLDLISEAREEQRKAREHGWNDGLEEAARFLEVVFDQPTMAQDVRAKKAKP